MKVVKLRNHLSPTGIESSDPTLRGLLQDSGVGLSDI